MSLKPRPSGVSYEWVPPIARMHTRYQVIRVRNFREQLAEGAPLVCAQRFDQVLLDTNNPARFIAEVLNVVLANGGTYDDECAPSGQSCGRGRAQLSE